MTIYTVALLILMPLLVWRIYSRVKAMMARQPSVMSRHWLGAIGFPLAILVVLTETWRQQALLGCLAAGTAFGIGWGLFALRRTRMERTEEGYFFKPFARTGLVIALLFAARVLYILVDLYANQGQPMQKFTDSPITVAALTLAAAYFGTISAGLLRWRLSQEDD